MLRTQFLTKQTLHEPMLISFSTFSPWQRNSLQYFLHIYKKEKSAIDANFFVCLHIDKLRLPRLQWRFTGRDDRCCGVQGRIKVSDKSSSGGGSPFGWVDVKANTQTDTCLCLKYKHNCSNSAQKHTNSACAACVRSLGRACSGLPLTSEELVTRVQSTSDMETIPGDAKRADSQRHVTSLGQSHKCVLGRIFSFKHIHGICALFVRGGGSLVLYLMEQKGKSLE